MPKLWVLSDLHLETLPYPSAFDPPRPDFDVLVAAGDIWESNLQAGMSFLLHLSRGKPIVMVLGNHEYWNTSLQETRALARAMARELGITLLDDTSAVVEGARFVGGTLWTDHRLGPHFDDDRPLGEPVRVLHGNSEGMMTVGDGRRLHEATTRRIEEEMDEVDDRPLVVVTHHAPHPECTAGFRGTWLAGHAASDLTSLTKTGRAALWIHGHVHLPVDMTSSGGTRILCNPAGNMFSNTRFDESLTIEL